MVLMESSPSVSNSSCHIAVLYFWNIAPVVHWHEPVILSCDIAWSLKLLLYCNSAWLPQFKQNPKISYFVKFYCASSTKHCHTSWNLTVALSYCQPQWAQTIIITYNKVCGSYSSLSVNAAEATFNNHFPHFLGWHRWQ